MTGIHINMRGGGKSLLENRIQKVKELESLIPFDDESKVCEEQLKTYFSISQRMGSESSFGEVKKMCVKVGLQDVDIKSCESPIILKQIPLTSAQSEMYKDRNSIDSWTSMVYIELICLKLCKTLIENKVCPNLPMYMKYFLCDNCLFTNPNLKFQKSECIILATEYANYGDLSKWLEIERTALEWEVMFFQVFAGLYALQKYFDITHHDLHWGNILVSTVDKNENEYFLYTIDGVDYYVPNIGFVFMIWDFGKARVPQILDAKEFQLDYLHDYMDFYVMSNGTKYPRYAIDYCRISDATRWVQKVYKTPQIDNQIQCFATMLKDTKNSLNKVFPSFFIKFKKQNIRKRDISRFIIIDRYSLDKKIPVDDIVETIQLPHDSNDSALTSLAKKNFTQILEKMYQGMNNKQYRQELKNILKQLK